MADYRATSTEFTAVADAIRTKGGTSAQLTWPNGFVSAVQAIPTGSGVVQPLSVTQNGTYNPPSGVDGYAPITVNVSGGGSNTVVGAQGGDEYTADSTFGTPVAGRFHIAESAPGTSFHNWWGSGDNGQHWWKVTFETAKIIKNVSFCNQWVYGSSQWQSKSVTLQGSNDDSTWTDLLTLTDLELSNDQKSYVVENNTAYIYYRFLCLSTETAYTGLGKIQMFV